MDVDVSRLAGLLHEAGETHHRVFRSTDGADDDWATWYSDWLVNHTELAELLGVRPVRSELTHLLVDLDREYTDRRPAQRWEDHYAARLAQRYQRASASA